MGSRIGLGPKGQVPTEVSVLQESTTLSFIHSRLLVHTKFFVLDGGSRKQCSKAVCSEAGSIRGERVSKDVMGQKD